MNKNANEYNVEHGKYQPIMLLKLVTFKYYLYIFKI